MRERLGGRRTCKGTGWLLAAALCAAGTALAQDPAGPIQPFDDALDRVWSQNPLVVQAEQQVTAAGFDIDKERTGYYPYAQVQSARDRNDNNSSVIALVMPLWSGGATMALTDAARARRDGALAALNLARMDVASSLAEAYFGLCLTQDSAQAWQDYVQALETLDEVIARRVEQGVSPESDRETVMSRLGQARAGSESNVAQLAQYQARLLELLNRPVPRAAWPQDPADADPVADQASFDTTGHPLHQSALAVVTESKASERVALAALWPELSVQYRRQIEGTTNPTDNESTLLVFDYQTGGGLRGYRGLQAGEARSAAAESHLEAADRSIQALVQSAAVARNAALRERAAQEQVVDANMRLSDSFLRQFRVGRKSWLDVLNMHREANDSRLQLAVIRRDFWVAETRHALNTLQWKRLSRHAPDIVYFTK